MADGTLMFELSHTSEGSRIEKNNGWENSSVGSRADGGARGREREKFRKIKLPKQL